MEEIVAKKRGRPKGVKNKPKDESLLNRELSREETDILIENAYYSDAFRAGFGGESNALMNGGRPVQQLPGALQITVPRINDYVNQEKWAIDIRNTKFVRGALTRRRKFIISGFKHHHKDQRIINLFNKIAKKSKLVKKLKQIQWEKDTVGYVVSWPDQINLIPQEIHLLRSNIRIENVFGYDNIYLKLDSATRKAILDFPENFPPYFYKQVSAKAKVTSSGFVSGVDEIKLENSFLISCMRDLDSPYPKSPLYPIFEPIKILEQIAGAQYAVSMAIKSLIMHVKVRGELDGVNKVNKRATVGDIKKVAAQVINGAKTANIVTDEGVTIEFISPDKGIFQATETPYNQALGRIRENINIPMLLVDGKADGVSYSSATFIIKGFLQDIIDERDELLNDFVYPWYEKISKDLYESDPKKYSYLYDKEEDEYLIPKVQFQETELKNIVELLSTLKFLKDTGAYSIESTMEMLQLDFPTEKSRKENENSDNGWIYSPFEPSQGMSHNNDFLNPSQESIQIDKDKLVLDEKLGLEAQKQKKQAQANKSKVSGSAGRPSSGKNPRSDNKQRNPRTSSASLEIDTATLLSMTDDPEKLAQYLIDSYENRK